jgi:hypothetical protein
MRRSELGSTIRKIKMLVLASLVIVAMGLCGCIWLAIPGLAYTGYQYKKTGKLPGMPSVGHDEKSTAQATPSDNSIE